MARATVKKGRSPFRRNTMQALAKIQKGRLRDRKRIKSLEAETQRLRKALEARDEEE